MPKPPRATQLLLPAAALLGICGGLVLGTGDLTGDEPPPGEARALADKIFENMTHHGFARPESARLTGCRLVITTNFARRCEGEPDNHSFVREVRDVDLRELSYESRDFGTTSSDTGTQRVWVWFRHSVAAKVRQIENARRAVISAERPGITPDDAANLERPMAISRLTEKMMKELVINSRQTLYTCSGQARVSPYISSFPIEVAPGNAEDLIADLVRYGGRYCSHSDE